MPTFLRIKRKRGDIPVESFSAESCAKRPRPSASSEVSLFRYVGSQSIGENNADIALTDLTKCSTNGSSRILWNTNHGKVIAGNIATSTDYKVNIQTLKRRASIGENVCPGNSNEPTEGPNRPKILKIIDLIPTTRLDDSLAAAVEILEITERSKQDDYNLQQDTCDALDYVFDIYRLECRKTQSSTSSPDENASGPIQSPELVLDDGEVGDEDGFEPGLHLEEDDDDSNSESNWRNDYPEEEDVSNSDSSSSRSSVSSSPSPTDHRMNGRRLYDELDRLSHYSPFSA